MYKANITLLYLMCAVINVQLIIHTTVDNKEFWKITKPFMSHKGSSAHTNISLIENDAIINDQTGVATV